MELLIWLFMRIISPALVISSTTISKISIARLPLSLQFAFKYLSGMTGLSQYICNEQVSRTQLNPNSRIYLHISSSFRHSRPSTQCRHMWAPDQFAQLSLTLMPLASTILMCFVLSGKVMSSTLWIFWHDRKSCQFWASSCSICSSNLVLPTLFPISIIQMSDHQIAELKKENLILQKQLESKGVENKNLTEKCDIQSKRIKFLKKEIDQLKLTNERLEQSENKMAAELKTAKDSNRKLKESMEELSKKIRQLEETGQSSGGKTVTIGERVIDSGLEQLDLASQSITDAEVKLLTHSKKLKTLILGDNSITDVGALQICDNLTNLTKLFLNNNQITDKGTENVYKLKQLKYLDLRANKLTGACAPHISKLTNLTQLSLSNNSLDDAAVTQLSKLTNLRYLDLTSNKLTNNCVQPLLRLKSLTHLYFSSNQLTIIGIKKLLTGFPELGVADARFNQIKNDERNELKQNNKGELQLFI